MTIKILIADDHKIMLNGLRSLLEKQHDMEVVAEANNGRTAVQQARKLKPDVVILDIAMPDLNGIEATRQITANLPEAKVIALSMHSDRRFIVEMFRSGASGYLLKDCAFEELVQAVRTVIAKKTYLDPQIANTLIKDCLSHLPTSLSSSLTAREREILQLIAEGKDTKQIASYLYLSVKTIETHRRHIMDKLDIHSIANLTKYAIREGLSSL